MGKAGLSSQNFKTPKNTKTTNIGGKARLSNPPITKLTLQKKKVLICIYATPPFLMVFFPIMHINPFME